MAPPIPANIPKSLLPLTKAEKSLLELYRTIKGYEKEAAKAASAAAQARLAAADEKFQQDLAQQGRAKEEALNDTSDPTASPGNVENGSNQDMDATMMEPSSYQDSNDDDVGNGPKDDVKVDLKKAMKRKIEKQVQDNKRKELLATESTTSDSMDYVPKIQKKTKKSRYDEPDTSLIANMEGQSTPLRDFSKSLGMSKVSGTQLYPDQINSPTSVWEPPQTASHPEEGCLELPLDGFDLSQASLGSGNNTVAIKFTAPSTSSRFSINIAGPNHDNYYNVLFHFNPRQFEKGGQVVINDKQLGIWGQGINIPMSRLGLMFGQTSNTLVVQINGDGFDVILDGQHCARLEHRTPLPSKACPLTLQFPSTDDYGQPEQWTVYRVWWGHKDSLAASDLSNVAGVNMHNVEHATKLFIRSLPKVFTEADLDLRKAELERAFRRYGGAHGVTVSCSKNSTIAFVEVETERQADLALSEMQGKYRINRARMSRHEALMEERALTGEGSDSATKTTSDWD